MRVRMNTVFAGGDPRDVTAEEQNRPQFQVCFKPGDILDLPEGIAREWIKGRFAEDLEPAVTDAAEATPKGGKRGGKGSKPAVTDAAAGA